MIHAATWERLKKALSISRNLSFTLNYARRASGPQWHAIITTERGRVIGRAMAGEADGAVLAALEGADWEGFKTVPEK